MTSSKAIAVADLEQLLPRLRRYPLGWIYAPAHRAADAIAACRRALPDSDTYDLLSAVEPNDLDRLIAPHVRDLTAAAEQVKPLVVTGSEALWSALSDTALDRLWRSLVLIETPPAPRLIVLHSPLYLDRLERALNASPQSYRLVRWTAT